MTAGSVDATGKDVEVSASGVLTAPTVTAANLKTAGSVTAATAINANVEQTDGEINAGDVTGGTFKQTGGTATLTGTLTAAVDQDAGTLSANAVVGSVDQDGGTMTVATTVTGDVAQNGSGSVTAAKIDGNVTQEAGNSGTVTTSEITKDLTQNGGTVVAKDNALTVGGMTTQNGGVIGDGGDTVTLKGKLTQTAGELKADALALKGGAEQCGGKVVAKSLILDNAAADVSLASTDNDFDTVQGTAANLTVKDIDDLALAGVAVAETLDVTAKSLTDSAANTAKDVELAIEGDATLDNDNDFDTVKGSAKNLTVNDVDEVKFLDTKATAGDLKVTAGGEITVDGEVAATTGGVLAKGAGVTVNADKSVTADGNIRIEATGSAGAVKLNGSVKGANVSVLALNGGSVSQNATITATAADGFVDVEAGGALNMAAGTTTEAKTIVYQGTGGTVSGKFKGDVNIAGVGIGGGAEMIGDKVVMDVSSLGSSGNAVKLNASEISINATGDIYVENSEAVTVKAHAGTTGVTVNRVQEDLSVANAGTMATSDIEGIISQNGNVSFVNDGNVTVGSGAGVIAHNGEIVVEVENGDVTLEKESYISGGSDVNVAATGNITINGDSGIGSDGNVSVKSTDQGDVTIGTVGASGSAGVAAYETGTVKIETAKGSVFINNGYIGSTKSTEVTVNAIEGSVDVAKGSLIANGDIKVQADVDVALANGTSVQATDGTVNITANRDAILNGKITATESADDVVVQANNIVEVGGDINAMAGTIAINADGTDAGDGVKVTGSVMGAKGVALTADGDVTVDGGLVKAGKFAWDGSTVPTVAANDLAALTVTAGKGVTLQNNAQVGASGEVDVDAKAGGVTVSGNGTALAANGAMNIDAEGGAVTVSDKAFVGGNSTVAVGVAGNTASAEVNGATLAAKGALEVTAKNSVLVTGADAKVASDDNVKLAATEATGTIVVESSAEVHGMTGATLAANDITVDNALVKAGKFSVAADGTVTSESNGDLTMTAGNKVEITGGAQVGASGDATVTANGADGISVEGSYLVANESLTVKTTAENGSVTVAGGAYVGANAKDDGDKVSVTAENGKVVIKDGATVASRRDVDITAAKDIVVDGNATKVGADAAVKLTTTTVDGSIKITGASVLGVESVVIDSKNAVTVGGAKVLAGKHGTDAMTGEPKFYYSGKDLKVTAKKGVTIENDSAVGASGKVEIDGGTSVSVSGSLVKAGEYKNLDMATGELDVEHEGSLSLAADEIDVSGKANVIATGMVDVDAKAGGVTVTGADTKLAAEGAMNIDAEGGAVTVSEKAFVGGNSTVAVGVAGNTASAEVNGATLAAKGALEVTAKNSVLVTGADAKVASDEALKLKATAGTVAVESGAKVLSEKAVDIDATVDVTVAGTVRAKGADGTVKALDIQAGNNVEVSGTVEATSGTVAINADGTDAGDGVKVTGSVTGANGVEMTADKDVLVDDGTIKATAGTVEMAAKNAISVTGTAAVEAGTLVKMTSTVEGNITIDTANSVKSENVEIGATKGNVVANSGTVDATGGSLVAATDDGNIDLAGGKVLAKDADFTASGDVYADNGANDFTGTVTAKGSNVTLKDANGINLGDVSATAADGDVLVETVAGDITVNDGATVQGYVTELSAKGNVKVNGTVSGTDFALVSAQGGNVEFDADGAVEGDTVTVEASGNITQADASVTVDGSGYANDQQLHAAVKANSANLIAGGSIGNAEQGTSDYVGVDAGSVAAEAGIDAAIAGANGSDINVDCVTAGADVSLFTTGTIRPNGTVTAGGDLTVSAKDFSGGAVKMNMNNALTVNNFQSGDKPLIAFFETNGGNKNPEINNQPNETIIFIDGRLAGGDIQAINLLGAVEAFPVQTPELKSEQGIFGNPLFLHDDLDVATPLAVGAIDYLLLELPRMELSSDFPIGVEKQVSANGLNPTTSYWFGQDPAVEEEDGSDDANDSDKSENKSGGDGSSPETGSNPVTAMK